jgi:two-component system cell cycle sensor histidine kinase/response regulator CckA
MLARFASALAVVGSVEELLKAVVLMLDQIVSADLLGFYRYDEAEERLILASWKGFTDQEASYAEMSAMDRHPGHVWRTGEVLVVADALLDAKGTSDSPRRELTRSRVWLPVIGQEQTLGVFGFGSARPNAFNEEDVASLQFVCAVAGSVWERQLATERMVGLERQLLQSQKMEVVGRLVSSIAHDFNNVLTVLMAQGGRIQHRAESEDSVADAQIIQDTCERAAELTRRLLTFSRPGAGEAGVLLLDEELARYERILTRLIPESIQLRVTHPAHALGVVIASSELEQVLLNLVVNARDAMPDGGQLQVDLSLRSDDKHLRWVVLSVVDSGDGMDDAVRARVFEPFFTTKRRGHGTGLGLSTVAEIVKSRGGRLVLHSEIGHGTTFEAWFPSASISAAHQTSAAPLMSTSLEGTVWLAEDDDTLRRLFTDALIDSGLDVAAEPNGALGLASWEAADERAAVLLTDLMMPGIGGIELATRLLSKWPDLRVLVMTGYPSDDAVRPLVEKFPESRIAAIDKPFNSAALVRTLDDLLGE